MFSVGTARQTNLPARNKPHRFLQSVLRSFRKSRVTLHRLVLSAPGKCRFPRDVRLFVTFHAEAFPSGNFAVVRFRLRPRAPEVWPSLHTMRKS